MSETFDEYEVWNAVIARVRAERPTPAAAAHIAIDAMEPVLTRDQSSALRAIDFGINIDALRSWFETLLRREPPDNEVVALYFGIFTRVFGFLRRSSAPAMYVCGCDRFDPSDRYCEWACGPVWFPEHRYPSVPSLRRLGKALPPKGLLQGMIANAVVFALAKDLVTHADRSVLLGNRPWLAVACGYDGGDAYIVGYVTQSGFLIDGPPAYNALFTRITPQTP